MQPPVQPYTFVALNTLLTKEQQCIDLPPTQPHSSITLSPPLMNDVKDKNVEIDDRNKDSKRKNFKIDLVVKCNKCQSYGHLIY